MSLPILYQTLKMEDPFEVRQYNYHCLAKVVVEGSFEKAYQKGAAQLTTYLSGDNYKKLRMDHRSLFMMRPRVEGWEVSCILPEHFTATSSPRPIGDHIQFEEVHSRQVAVHRFRGKSAYATMMRKMEELKSWAKQTNLNISPSGRIVVYSSSVISFLRRNEIQFDSVK